MDNKEPLIFDVFDPTVSTFVTPRVYRILYGVTIALIAAVVGITEYQLTRSGSFPFWGQVLGGFGIVLAAIVLVLLVRIGYETTLVFFRTEEHLRMMRQAQPQVPELSMESPPSYDGRL